MKRRIGITPDHHTTDPLSAFPDDEQVIAALEGKVIYYEERRHITKALSKFETLLEIYSKVPPTGVNATNDAGRTGLLLNECYRALDKQASDELLRQAALEQGIGNR